MSLDPQEDYSPEHSEAQERTRLPGLFLMIVGFLNLPWVLYLLLNAGLLMFMPQEKFDEVMNTTMRNWGGGEALQGFTPEQLRTMYTVIGAVWAVLALVAALLTIQAGRRLRELRSTSVVLLGSLAACVPFVACSGTCCFGQVVGLWAIITVLSSDVRAAFR